MSACPKSQTCNSFDYDNGFGVYLQDSHDVTIDQATANADDTGSYVLDNSWNVNLGNSSCESAGPICITLNGQKTATGYFTDLQRGLLLINGSHGNVIHDDLFAANSGTGIGSGGNGFVFSPCTGSKQHLHQRVLFLHRHRQSGARRAMQVATPMPAAGYLLLTTNPC